MLESFGRVMGDANKAFGKAYGVHLLKEGFPFKDQLPLREDLPRIPEPYASENFYYHEVDALQKLAHGKSWTWCEVRPDVVVGYVPNNNTYCLAQTLGIYLSLYAAIEGHGASCPYPGPPDAYTALANTTAQDILARFSIYASLHPSATGERAFNVADDPSPSSWSKRWPIICEWFGLQGAGPAEGAPEPAQYIKENHGKWSELVKKHDLRPGVVDVELGGGKGGYQYFIMTLFDFDRHCDLSAMKESGFDDVLEGDRAWLIAFERFRKGKAIP
ncbi:hypothetical protein MMC08_001115 [Hypocenomyce scalaris]|nr:hypothetical protein [Hypocenomyce scalaris]